MSNRDLLELQQHIRTSNLIKTKMFLKSKRISFAGIHPENESPLVFLALQQASADQSAVAYKLFEWWINSLVKDGVSFLNLLDGKTGNSLLMEAISAQDLTLCDMMLNQNTLTATALRPLYALPNKSGLTPLHFACQMGMKRVVQVRIIS